jgi:hypothetical protein
LGSVAALAQGRAPQPNKVPASTNTGMNTVLATGECNDYTAALSAAGGEPRSRRSAPVQWRPDLR